MIRQDEVDFAVGSMLDIPGDISYEPALIRLNYSRISHQPDLVQCSG